MSGTRRVCELCASFANHFVLTALGKYSYGLYVFHFIVIAVVGNLLLHFPAIGHATMTETLPAICLLCANVLISFALTISSYHLYEKHFLKLKRYFPENGAAVPVASDR